MANETMRIFFSLKIIISPQGECGLEDNPMEITPAEAVMYEDAILAATANENRFFENDRGFAEYIHENYSLKLELEMKNNSPDHGYGGPEGELITLRRYNTRKRII